MARKHAKRGGVGLGDLPENCISTILSLTSPADVALLAAVSKSFNSAAESDTVWERFLPPEYGEILQRAVEPLSFSSKKAIFQRLSVHPVLIDGGRKSFGLERLTGKKCFMLSARELTIIWSHESQYWRWVSLPAQESRFPEVAELLSVCWLEIRGKFNMMELSSMTTYSAYLVFKLTTTSYDYGLLDVPCETRLSIAGLPQTTGTVYLDQSDPQQPRKDGWMEVNLGEFFNEGADHEEMVEMGLYEIKKLCWKSDLIVQGVEIRPK